MHTWILRHAALSPRCARLAGETGGKLPQGSPIADLAWDPTGARLAALLRPPHPAAGLVALFSTPPGARAPARAGRPGMGPRGRGAGRRDVTQACAGAALGTTPRLPSSPHTQTCTTARAHEAPSRLPPLPRPPRPGPIVHAELVGFVRPFAGGDGVAGGAPAGALAWAPKPGRAAGVLSVLGEVCGGGGELLVANVAISQ